MTKYMKNMCVLISLLVIILLVTIVNSSNISLQARYHLSKYEFSGQSDILARWLFDYAGEMPSHNKVIDFGYWSIDNPNEFYSFLNFLSDNQKEKLLDDFVWAMRDVGEIDAVRSLSMVRENGDSLLLRSKVKKSKDK